MSEDNQQSWKSYVFTSKGFKYFSTFNPTQRSEDQKSSIDDPENKQKSWKETLSCSLDGVYGFVKSNVLKHIESDSKVHQKTKYIVEGLVKGGKMFYYLEGQYLKIKTTPALKILVSDARINYKILFRLDHPHPGAQFNHFNINPKVYNLAKDPHFWLPPGSRHVSDNS
jgi:hypothetical protein